MTTEDKPKPATREEILARLSDKEHLAGADFSGLDMSQIKLTGLAMPGANFSHTNLQKAVIAGMDLTEADFSGADLEEALMAGVNVTRANFQGANLKGAKVNATNFESANLSGADLSATTFVATNVSGADFTQAITTNARSSAVGWRSARVSPAETPAAMRPPLWAIGLSLGVVAVIVFLVFRKRKSVA